MVAHVISLSTQAAEADKSLCVWGQPGRHIYANRNKPGQKDKEHIVSAMCVIHRNGSPRSFRRYAYCQGPGRGLEMV